MANKVLIIDPNASAPTPYLVTPEQLTISVELRTFKKDRSAILTTKNTNSNKSTTTVKTGSNKIPIQFIGGSDVGNGEKSLTTHYTELSTNFNSENKDLETLGVRDINIEFNTSYAPLIVINFVDVRGKLFEMGQSSPYNVFFELPYPIFELTVKGYYGTAVTYKLHLTKFNGKFNYSTGSFEIQCSFVGYTYAFLSDILMGYLKGITYTKSGIAKVKEKRESETGNHLFLTFEELNNIVKSIDGKVMKLKDKNPQLKAIKKGEEVIGKLTELKETVISNLNVIGPDGKKLDTNVLGFHAIATDDIGFGQSQTTGYVTYQPEDETIADIITYNNTITAALEETNGILDSGYKLTDSKFLIKENQNYFKHITKSDFESTTLDSYLTETNGTIRQNSQLTTTDKYNAFKTAVLSVSQPNNFVEFRVIDLTEAFAEIETKIKLISDEIKNTIPILGDTILNDSELFTYDGKYFQPTINNLFRLICDHVDIFLDCIREVAVKAEEDTGIRARDLKRVADNLDKIDGTLGNLKAFPSYMVDDALNGGKVDRWIGTLAPDIPEVKFIEDLLEGIIKSKKNDDAVVKQLEAGGGEVQWYPINTFDSVITGVANPYKALKVDAKVDDYLRLVILRALTYLGYSNKTVSSDGSVLSANEINLIGKLEANNAFTSIINKDIKAALRSYSSDATSMSSKLILEAQTNKFINSQDGLQYVYGGTADSSIIEAYDDTGTVKLSSDNSQIDLYKYKYISRVTSNNKLDGRNLLPLTTPNSYKEYNGDFMVKNGTTILTNSDRIKLRDTNKAIFFSDIINGTDGTIDVADDGATTIKIFKDKSNIEGKVNYPTYGDVSVEAKTINIENKIIDAGITNNFFRVNYGSYGNMPTSFLFYSDAIDAGDKINNFTSSLRDRGEFNDNKFNIGNSDGTPFTTGSESSLINFRKKKSLIDVLYKGANIETNSFPFLGFSTGAQGLKFTSLFGSDLYYSQDNIEAKAYLFLHSIPFDGLDYRTIFNGGLFKGKVLSKLFNQKAGFIEAAHPWILFVGALLSRKKGNFTVKFSNSTMSYIPSLSKSVSPSLNDFCYNTNSGFFSFTNDDFVKIDDILLNLPESAKREFINAFEVWIASGSFDLIRKEFEIFKDGVTQNQRYNFWRTFNTRLKSDSDALYSDSILNSNLKRNYNILMKPINRFSSDETKPLATILNEIASDDFGSPFNFFLEAKDKSPLVRTMFNFLSESRVIANSSWRTWHDVSFLLDYEISTNATDLKNYLNSFFFEFIRLSDEQDLIGKSDDEASKDNLFQSINNDDIKLKLYKNIKSIYDKWICGEDEKYVGMGTENLFDSFRFIDRAYNKIGDKFKINLVPMVRYLTDNYNQSFYNYTARVLSDNNFDFIPLPTFINYNNADEVNNVFKAFTYNNTPNSLGPQFVCMYIGERSNVLDYGGNFKDDGFDFPTDSSVGNVPNDLTGDFSEKDGSDMVPVFLVQYGDEKQSVFKDIQLDQNEFTATDESLVITNNLTAGNGSSGIGQNLFDIYNNRSYTAHVEMLGNTMIQPFMYFQLNGVPIFHGAYTIIRVKHSIKANSMITNFDGVRIRSTKTKLVDETTIFMNMFSGLDGISTDDANLNSLYSDSERENITVSQYSEYVTYKVDEGSFPGLLAQSASVERYAIKEVGQFIEYVSQLWYNQSLNQPYSNILYYNDLSRRGGGKLGIHQLHKIGTSIDIRPISKNKKVGLVSVGSANYDKDATIKFIRLMLDTSKTYKGWVNNRIVKTIYFNDEAVIENINATYGSIVKSSAGHANHMHIEFYVPERVEKLIKEGNTSGDENPDVQGMLEIIPRNSRPNKNQRKSSLGKI